MWPISDMLLWAGAVGSWLFIVVFLVDGLTRPGYRPLRQPVSALALGSRGWLQIANFVVCGLLITVGAFALDDVLLTIAVTVFGVVLVASGVFPMDAMQGYPPGAPEGAPENLSLIHKLHDWAGAAVFSALPVAALIAVFVLPSWQWYSGLTCAGATAGFLTFGQAWENDSPYTGLIQRATIIVGWSWLGFVFAAT